MLPLQSLLNPISSRPITSKSHQASPVVSSLPPLTAMEGSSSAMDNLVVPRTRISRAGNNAGKSKPQGPINFPPWENIDQVSLREIDRFRVRPFGEIHLNCEHIPYNSAKKDFYEKTGRESIEAFKYEFRVPGQACDYTVMWDYNIGLVRMTPFFKCQGYAKTKPSQMLDKSPGLRDISPSVTGGAVTAQGYWMPYSCAKAVCATFCYEIAGAMIPLFGPDFPSKCTPPHSPYYKEMAISHDLIAEATRDVNSSRRLQMIRSASNLNAPASQPHFSGYPFRGPQQRDAPQPSLRLASSWSPINARNHQRPAPPPPPPPAIPNPMSFQPATTLRRRPNMPVNRYTSIYDQFQYADPYRNAIPRPPPAEPQRTYTETWTTKRRRTEDETHEVDYAGATLRKIGLTGTAAYMERQQDQTPSKRDPNGEDYAAAEVLVCLQQKTQASVPSAERPFEPVPLGLTTRDMRRKKRPKAKSF